jgi:uncharacterized membrane protein
MYTPILLQTPLTLVSRFIRTVIYQFYATSVLSSFCKHNTQEAGLLSVLRSVFIDEEHMESSDCINVG